MRLLIFFLILFCIIFSFNIFPQSNYTISGTIKDSSDNSVLIGADIYISELKTGTITDEDGRFTIKNIPDGKYNVKFSSLGYHSLIKEIIITDSSINLEIKLLPSTINLKEVVITGNPFMVEPKDITQSIVKLDKLDLLIKQNRTVAQTLNFQPGISVRSNGVAASRPVIRGFSNNMVLILENGLRMGDLSSSSDDHSVSDDGSEPDKIEVLEGPASLLYGSEAIGGVVNVIKDVIPTTIPDGFEGEVISGISSVNNEYLGGVHLNYGLDRISFHGKVYKRQGDDYKNGLGIITNNSNLQSYGTEAGFSYHPDWGITGISYTGFNSKYGLPTIPSSDEGVYIDMKKNEGRFLTNVNNINSFITSLNLKAGYLDYHHKEISKFNGFVGTEFGLKTFTGDLSFNHQPIIKNSNGIIGFYGLTQKYKVFGEEALTPPAEYYNYAVYLLEQFKFGRFSTQVGGRFETIKEKFPAAVLTDSLFNSFEKNYNTFSYSFGTAFEFIDNYSLFLNIANAFRTPSIEELSAYGIHEASGSFDIGTRNLKTLNNIGFDLGLRGQTNNFYFEVTGFYNSINNFIYRSPQNLFYSEEIGFNDVKGFRVYKYSQANASIYGFEGKVNYEFINDFTATVISDFVRGRNNETKTNLPQIPPFRIALELRYAKPDYWIGGAFKIAAPQNKVAQNEDPTKGYGLIDVYGGYKFLIGNFVNILMLNIDNLLDQPYKDHLSAIKDFTYMPGRNISLRYKFIF